MTLRPMPGFLADVLSRKTNGSYTLAIKTALTWGRTPMEILFPLHVRAQYGDLNLDRIAQADINLMQAWQILTDETCQKCGVQVWIGHNPDNYLAFEVETTHCYSCEAIEAHDAEERKGENPDPHYGETSYSRPYMHDNKPLPSRREGLRMLAPIEELA